ncbi:MAG: bifunctional hydroxymethylpyrimidine kinase/phosphomethylpyrimidine kinase [Pseudomonadota bacterium]
MRVKKVLTIAGSDSGGGAGIQADLKTITALGGFGMSVVTALTAQNTLGVTGIHEVPADFVAMQFDAVASDIGIDAAKTGMLASAEILRMVAAKVRQYGIEKLVVDPVMVAKGGARLIREDAREALVKELIPLACITTPNIPEAEVLSGMLIAGPKDMRTAAAIIHKLGARHVVVKGGHLSGAAIDILYDGQYFHEFKAERIATVDTHGTGCTFSAAIATGLADGKSARDAVDAAKKYIQEAIRYAWRIGGGHGPTNHFAPVFREISRYHCLAELKSALQRLLNEPCGGIIPEVQSNMGYALPDARTLEDVAAVPGRIIRVGERVGVLCEPAFGASRHIAKIILTAMRYDPEIRCAINIRFSEDIVRLCTVQGFRVDHFDRSGEPPDVREQEGSSLEWGTNVVLSRGGAVPDMIFDRGDVGKEPMIRVLGTDPGDVVNKVLKVANGL